MSRKTEVQAQIASLQTEYTLLNRVPSDAFSFGTIVVFASATSKWYYLKVAEETWRSMQGTTQEKDLASWVAFAYESAIGYFEVYELKVQPTPFFASA
jgi:hypothetical protein